MEKNNEYMMFCPKCATTVYPQYCNGPLCKNCGAMMLQSKTLRASDIHIVTAYTSSEEAKKIRANNKKLKQEQFEAEILPLGQFDISHKVAKFNYDCLYGTPYIPDADPKPDVPKCPICGSTNLKKISAANKVGSVALFGLLAAGHVSKTWKCENCGSKF